MKQPKLSIHSDQGSALPLFLFGTALLVLGGLIAVTATSGLAQQRRLNGVADAVALAAAEAQVRNPARDVSEFAAEALQILGSNRGEWLVSAGVGAQNRVTVRLCQPNKFYLLPQGPGTEVCVASTAMPVT
ncbi:MAG: hypothetical protein RIQ44_787 [Actinomycetota bacterium]